MKHVTLKQVLPPKIRASRTASDPKETMQDWWLNDVTIIITWPEYSQYNCHRKQQQPTNQVWWCTHWWTFVFPELKEAFGGRNSWAYSLVSQEYHCTTLFSLFVSNLGHFGQKWFHHKSPLLSTVEGRIWSKSKDRPYSTFHSQ